MDIDELVARLTTLGMTEDDARVYVTLLRTGPCRASTVHAASGFSRTKCYRLLDNLVEQGVVESTLQTPTIHEAHPPEEVFEKALRRLEDQRERIETLRTETVDTLDRMTQEKTPTEEGYHWNVIQGRTSVYDRLQRLIVGAQQQVQVISNQPITLRSAPLVEQAWRTAAGRAKDGVSFRFLLDLDQERGGVLERWIDPEAMTVRRFTAEEEMHLALVDDAEILFWLAPSPSDQIEADDEVAILTDAPGLVGAGRLLFEWAWAASEQVDEISVS